ncbi:hypothetical protein [Larkinella terrae]|uniref:Uncharacterized protein n=1 Tax=Larkinella terrae TaxID=2025311 RepID=A0A7K0EJH1_9BACT|nr:hypothetical protein [Larkinella terrae]MRS61671.1 hypothetical protein [Larkinella terrae]
MDDSSARKAGETISKLQLSLKKLERHFGFLGVTRKRDALTVQCRNGEFDLPRRWEDVTLEEYLRLSKGGFTPQNAILSLASDPEVAARLSTTEYRAVIKTLDYLSQPVQVDDLPVPTVIAGMALPENAREHFGFVQEQAMNEEMEKLEDLSTLDWVIPTLRIFMFQLMDEPVFTLHRQLNGIKPKMLKYYEWKVKELPFMQAIPLAKHYLSIWQGTDSLPRVSEIVLVYNKQSTPIIPEPIIRKSRWRRLVEAW